MSEEVIKVNHLSKSFGKHVVLRDIDFSVSTGDVTCIIGASGSGKSTLLRCMNLLETQLPERSSIMAKILPTDVRMRPDTGQKLVWYSRALTCLTI